jgi:hypothetical protein
MAKIEIRDVLDNETGETIFPRTHVKAVIGLVDSSFFEEYTDGNGTKSVRLRAEYAGLWADGWISAGGIGTGGGGGGGSTHLKTLLDVYHSSSSVLRADGTPVQNGDALVYDGNNSRWYAAPVSGGGGQIQPATDATLGGVKVGSVISTPTINPVSAVGGRYYYLQTDSNGLAFVNVPWEGGGGGGGSGSVTLVKVGQTSYSPDSDGIVSLPEYPTSLPASDVSAWAKAASKPSYTFSEIGSKPSTISGYGITDAKISNGVITLGGNTITPLTSSSVYGLTLQSGSFSGGTYNPASGSGSFNIPTTLDHVSDGSSRKLSDYVTKAGVETISGAKTFSANTTFSANLSVASNKHIDLGPIRIEYDSMYNALRITSNDGTTVNFYCDGFVTAGGVNNN